MDFVSRKHFEAWDLKICLEATAWDAAPHGPAPLACRLAPTAYRQWREHRVALADAQGGQASFNAGYIDDEMAMVFGTLRAIAFLVIYWAVLELFGFPPAVGKATLLIC